MRHVRWMLLVALAAFLPAHHEPNLAAPPTTAPAEGLRDNTPAVYALTGGRIVVAPGRKIDAGTIVIRDGRISDIGAEVAVPDDARKIDVSGMTVYPGLIDAFSEATVDTSFLTNGAPHWNSLVRPQLSLAEHYTHDADLNEKLRSQGITARLAAPQGGIIKGSSVLVTTGDRTNSAAILKAGVAQHVRLTVSPGRGRNNYPNSPMGAVALARQAMYDANWYRSAWQAHNSEGTLPRPERNDALAALVRFRETNGLAIFDTSNELFVLRADRFAREFGVRAVIRGSGNEYRRLDAIRKTGRAVIVPVDFPKPPNVETAEAAMNVSLERLMHWDIAPENAARLDRAGVTIALTSHGLKDKASFLEAVRTAVERGLPADAALRALTTAPAELYGVSDRIGTLEIGKAANLVIVDGELFAKKTNVLETWVDGERFQMKTPPLFVLAGDWELKTSGADKLLTMSINEDDGKLSGKIRPHRTKPGDKREVKLSRVALRDARVSSTFDAKIVQRDGIAQLTAVVEATEEGEPIWSGHITWPDGGRSPLTARRAAPAKQANKSEDQDEETDGDKAPEQDPAASFAVNYPLGAFGRTNSPAQPKRVLFTGATIWTCGETGVLENASLLIGEGKILAVGLQVDVPDDAIVIDCNGKHISPGIIDCHSHMATDGGVNESTQAITAEVRIGDFIDCDDINIYRQLAGGVTSSNILHGSANPIGGQNQVIKLRWGQLSETMKLAEAPQGIKFALGENVKQSNWGDEYTTRYPQTRMGVEQIMRDEFEAARGYQRRWEAWRRTSQGLPPRRDLELEAISEILAGDRWIHCHSYRQDEILALIRLLDKFEITIGTFQHILEGYKVADAMAKHGAMGSAFSDWWAYKFEVYDAIPYNGTLMHNAGVVVSFNSDDRELARHLNHEAAKAVKYGGVEPLEALKFVTLNPAKQLRIDKHVGSIEPGKHADVVVWSDPPLSNFARCEQTWIDGRKYFDREEDLAHRAEIRQMRTTLIQKILASGQEMQRPGDEKIDPANLWPREDEYCHHHGHGHGDH